MKRIAFFLLLSLVSAIIIHAQTDSYEFRNLTATDGLSQSTVIAIHQDKLGQMWFGTRDGLNKYDGNSFKIYRNKINDTLSISNSDILTITEDSEGMLWIGTYNGLNRYNPINNTFKRYFHTNNTNSLAHNTVWKVKEIGDKIWIGTSNGLSIYNKGTKTFSTLFNDPDNPYSLPGNYVLSILEDKEGEIWVGTSKGLCKLINNEGNNYKFIQFKSKDILYVQDIIADNQNNIFIATKSNGLYKINTNSKILVPFKNVAGFKGLDLDLRSMDFDEQGNLWLGTNSGVVVFKPNGELNPVINKPNAYSGLSKVKSIYTDKNGSVWIGTYYGGVSLWDKSNTNFTNLHQNIGENSLGYNVVSSIVSDKNENIYFGTEGGGITVIDNNTGKSNYINSSNTKGLSDDNIKSILLKKNELWIGTFSDGLSIFSLKTKRITNSVLSKELQTFLVQLGVYVIKQENENIIWLGTFGKGLIRYNIAEKSFKNFQNEPDKSNSLSNNRIRSMLIDSKNRLWTGTQSGLNLFSLGDLDKKEFEIDHFFYNKEIISGIDILTIYEDSSTNIWVGTKANGFYLFDGTDFIKVPLKKDNLEITSIHAILEDDDSNLWLSSNHGVIKYNAVTKNITIYDQTDGLVSNEYNDNAALKLNSNRFYFGGPAGVSTFNPKSIAQNTYSPQVILTGFRIMNTSVHIDGKDAILKNNISYTNKLELNYDMANFSLNFAIPNFINPSNNQYTYRLVGLENAWNTTSNNEVNYTIQNPGTYIFEVKGANNDGVWNEKSTTLEILVHPAPWRSWWAFTIYALLIGIALFILLWFLKSKAKLKHELELEHIENIRNEEINEAKLKFFTNISHEFRTPLTLISGPLQQLLSDYTGSNKMYKKLLVIESSANHLLQLINRLMDFRKLENKELKLQSAEGNIVKFLKEIHLSFTEFARNGNYTYTFDVSDEVIPLFYDRVKLERVFYNLISNAFRYTSKGGSICVRVIKKESNLVIEVEDSGVGIAEENLDKIFDRFFEIPIHNKPQENYNKGTGIGLSIVKNIVDLHKGYIEVKSKSTDGTIFRVILPLGRLHLSDNEIINDFKISDDISQYESQLEHTELSNNTIYNLVVEENKPTLLVVEDHKPLRLFIKNLLKKDYNVIEAEDGKVALKKVLKFMPDLVISDVIVPNMVGTELCTKIKENINTSHIPVILLTSRTSLIYKFEGLESGADDYISKPFNIKEFKLRIKNILDATLRLKNKFSSEAYLKPSDITVNSIDEKLLKKAFNIVEKNISNDQFDIPFFGSELGVSRTMLFTKIKAWTNFTPNEFIHEIRMKRAVQLLEQNKINISQVCYKTGFKNPKYFSKCFQKKYGITPTQYRNKFFESIE
ncbi:hybrid sensor histidine kinase/response regulator transcription factor [Aureibaculum luteum]|uniref:hybrid sensor histidine kinase/response regulator transcription factor n=1 Tax=Aureibaculum luteum TaxID=1548456 RepID=UPI000E534A76|nr:hybrid sensor histidine kinase/response regulator transcription factor [Aureibaculum luteum]